MAKSLLAYLYPRIKGSQEDIATISLQYLLSQSHELNKAFTKMVASSIHAPLDDCLDYICQSTGDENERPDMAGIDKTGQEVVLCEMKFYAGLTANQPLTYLERLRQKGGYGCVFICPKSRQTNLWAKLKELCIDQPIEEVDSRCIRVDGIHLSIMTWVEILECLRTVAASSDSKYQSDIEQLSGYCSQMDSDAFIPFRPEDLTAEAAKNAERYYEVIDETFNLLCAEKNITVSPKGKASTYRTGYERKLEINGLLVRLNYDRNLWKSTDSVETPFWVSFNDTTWQQSEIFKDRITKISSNKQDPTIWDLRYFALEALPNATLDEICVDLKQQVLRYVSLFQDNT